MVGWFLRLVFWIFLIGYGTSGLAQNTRIVLSGTILHSKTRQPLPSITILKPSINRGTISDEAGKFKILVQPGDTLLIRALGFKSLHYVVHSQVQADVNVDILLEEGSYELPEVKVVGGLDYEKVNRVLRNMKKPAQPRVVVKPPEPKPLYPEKKFEPTAPTIENPASLLYDMLSKEGKEKRILQEMAEEKRMLEERKKQQAYDSLFKDRNVGFR
ncbi:carboxypeptidase-like regulatory domain-containing protein [Adhaeribacter aquaticus]|uniref:carboxypeptidase-like regulatory domain-containing protein n=1 Tax=Adhaeribacter aquaticus TaxID=299567 RepID=UPI0003F7EAE2|nr:carboxypeptidase-like regulatory domain-containing protein [Adhaeribacter aquaticus]